MKVEFMKEDTSDIGRLLPLMFAMGRLLKREISKDSFALPSLLHLETLRFISEEHPGMSDVAEYLKVTAPTATALVNGMVKDGILTRVEDTTDRRRVRLSLTKEGARVLADTLSKREAAFRRVIAPLSKADRTELARILTIITTL